MKYNREYLKKIEEAIAFEDQESKLHGDKKKSEQTSFMSFLTILWKPVDNYLWRRKVKRMKRR